MVKIRIRNAVLFLSGLLLLSALAVETVEQLLISPKTVETVEELLEIFKETRVSIPPLPSPVSYEDVAKQLSEDCYDFISHPMWAYAHDAGTYYLSDKSKLAKKLNLPIRLLAYEDLASGQVVLAATSLDSKDVQSLAIVDAPNFSPYDGKRSVESYLMQDLWPRRVIWSAILKSESDAWADLLQQQQAESISAEPMMMAMSLPESITDFRIIQDGTNLSVNLPDEFAGAEIVLLSCTNLVEGSWSAISTNAALSSGEMFLADADIPSLIYETSVSTNWINCPNHTMPGETCTNQTQVVITNSTPIGGGVIFYRTSASSTVDSDSDGLDNVSEYGAGTDYLMGDTSGDGLLDGWLVTNGLNPLSLNALGDGDNDGYSNLEEQTRGTDPDSPDSSGSTGTVATIRYYYDGDDRLTDIYCGTEAAQKLSPDKSYNLSEEVLAK